MAPSHNIKTINYILQGIIYIAISTVYTESHILTDNIAIYFFMNRSPIILTMNLYF